MNDKEELDMLGWEEGGESRNPFIGRLCLKRFSYLELLTLKKVFFLEQGLPSTVYLLDI